MCPGQPAQVEQHGGALVLSAARAYGVETMFTLSGAHVFPVYDAAVHADPQMRIIDVRHEQTAVFAAEATAKLTRRPGLAVLTAGPGVTNGISAVAQAYFSGIPLLVLGGRAPAYRWGSGALQELDHPPLLSSITRYAATAHKTADIQPVVTAALQAATTPHRGPAFVDVPMDQLFAKAVATGAAEAQHSPHAPADDEITETARLLADAQRPVLVIGTDVWTGGAEEAAVRLVEATGVPAITNGMGRGVVPRRHPLLFTKARTVAFAEADLVIVVGTPLDFRLNYGSFGAAQVVHIADAEDQIAQHVKLAAATAGNLAQTLEALSTAWSQELRPTTYEPWVARLRDAVLRREAEDTAQLSAVAASGVHPARVYGELLPLLTDDTVIIGDGGDFVSWAGRFIEPVRPGCWLDPGPYGCLGAGVGAAIAARIVRPDSPVVVLLGDGAAGLSLFDVDTLVRHDLPVLLIVGNNGIWGLEKGPMKRLYGYDVAADLRRETRYDVVAEALGARGETVRSPEELQSALRRGLAAREPYVVNVLLDPTISYPRSTTGL